MMKTFLLVSAILAYLHMAGALQCYSCNAYRSNDMKECLNIDGTAEVETCPEEYTSCFEVGIDYKKSKKYSNQRGCSPTKICDDIKYEYKDQVRKCRDCSSDKCNNSTLSGK
ncbi:hypothetical protein HHI36_012221 [Cryptolaemus montrouzieri]|uniref:Uncharacterized protein n=1 Tax=Cryptolaemus montrouzieri TaxID=559131 RepID=A0ABD2NDN6_9CUCU